MIFSEHSKKSNHREKLEKDGLMVPKRSRETSYRCLGGLIWIRQRCFIAGFSKLEED